jgi:putative phosphoesterase
MDRIIADMKGKIDVLFHCGDYCAPFMLDYFLKAGVPVHLVWGNTDDRTSTQAIVDKNDKLTHYGVMGEVEMGGKRIGFTHFPHIAEEMAKSGKFDVVFHGHTHERRNDVIGNCRIINPGEVMGRKNPPSYAVYDSETDYVQFFEVKKN